VFAVSRKCVNSPNLFYYVCGEFTAKSQTKFITPIVKKAYELYFGCKIGDQGKSWAPHSRYLRGLDIGTQINDFLVPIEWRE
jgi:hypothetical protein